MVIHPKICEECENVYCQKCIDKSKGYNNACPSCKESPMKIKDLGRKLKNILSKIEVKCVKCEKIVTYENFEKHFNDECGASYECKLCNKRLTLIEKETHFDNHMIRNGKDEKENIIFILSNIIRCYESVNNENEEVIEMTKLLKKIYDY